MASSTSVPSRPRQRLLFAVLVLATVVTLLPAGVQAQDFTTQISGGNNAEVGEYPYVALVAGRCTGTLIHPSWVLTAAHCVDGSTDPSNVGIAFGLYDRWNSSDPRNAPVYRTASQVHLHPQYLPPDTNLSFDYDIAVVRLSSPVYGIAPIRIGGPGLYDDYVGTNGPWITGTVAGWGKRNPTGISTGILQELDTKMRNHGWMEKLYTTTLYKRSIHIGAGGFDVGGGLCVGDSGGPFITTGSNYKTKQAGAWVHAGYTGPIQVGVLSMNLASDRCDAGKAQPARYTRTDEGPLLSWVVGTVRAGNTTLPCGPRVGLVAEYVWRETATSARCGLSLASLSVSDASAWEGMLSHGCRSRHCAKADTAVFTVKLNGPAVDTVRVSYATQNGTATATSGDYAARAGTLVFSPGQTQKTVLVPTGIDSRSEGIETFSVKLSGASGPAGVVDAVGAGSIYDGIKGL